MSTICIGPVCIPVWHLFALLAFLVGPCWTFIRTRILGQSPEDVSPGTELQSGKYQGAEGQRLKASQKAKGDVSPLKHVKTWADARTAIYSSKGQLAFLKNEQVRIEAVPQNYTRRHAHTHSYRHTSFTHSVEACMLTHAQTQTHT